MAVISGNEGAESLTGTGAADTVSGMSGDDAVFGYDGNDTIDGGKGDDFLYGGSGLDLLIGGAGEDFFYGQSGVDTASYAAASVGLTLDLVDTFLSTGDARGDFFFSVEQFVLSGLNDIFVGSSRADTVQGSGGSDLLSGHAGDDRLFGGSGDDMLDSGSGLDRLFGGDGVDTASYLSSPGQLSIDLTTPGLTTGDARGDLYSSIEIIALSGFDDFIRLAGAIRSAEGRGGNDQLLGNTGNDRLFGGDNNDRLTGDTGDDLLDGGLGDDSLFGGLGRDAFVGGGGQDAVFFHTTVGVNLVDAARGTGEARGDTFNGIETVFFISGSSTYVGGSLSLTVDTQGTRLTCIAGSGSETFINRSGEMSVSYAGAAAGLGLTASLTTLSGTGVAAGDRLQAATRLILTDFADVLDMTGSTGMMPATILAGGGDDRLTLRLTVRGVVDTGTGRDVITGTMIGGKLITGLDSDTVSLTGGGGGADIEVIGGSGNDVVTLNGYAGKNVVSGGSGDDTITANLTGTVRVDGGVGNDILSAIGAAVAVEGGSGDDKINLSLVPGSGGLASANGGEGNDLITFVAPASGGPPLVSQAFLNGGGGNDRLVGAVLSLLGDQSFVFNTGWGIDTVENFNDGDDRIRFSGTASAGLDAFGDLTVSGGAGFTQIDFGGNRITLTGFDVADFSSADVIFV